MGTAVIALALVGTVFLSPFAKRVISGHPSTPVTHVVETQSGQRIKVPLPDGSVVQLAPMSRMQYTDAFGHSARDIVLEGEAVFTVTRNTSTPFTVRAQQTVIQVLGTTFGVRGYATDSAVRVVVANGKVQVNHHQTLSIGDLSVVTATGNMTIEHDVRVSTMLGWTEGRLVFDGVPLSRLARDLERWYGVTIDISDTTLANQRVFTEFSGHSLDDVLTVLSRSLHMRVVRQGPHITLSTR